MNKTPRLLTLILVPLIIVVIGGTAAFLTVYFVSRGTVDEDQRQLLQNRVEAIGSSFSRVESSMSKAAVSISEDFPEICQGLIDKDEPVLYKGLDRISTIAGFKGFIALDMAGAPVCTSLQHVDASLLPPIASSAHANGSVKGCGTFLRGNICSYACAPVFGPDGDMVGSVIFVGAIANDKDAIMKFKEEHSVDVYLFMGGNCVCASNNIDINRLTLTPAQIDSCTIQHTLSFGEGKIGNSDFYEACLPLIDYDGQTNGIMMLAMSQDPVTNISNRVGSLLVLMWLAVIATVCFMIWTVTSRVTRPIKRLVNDVRVMATGDLTRNMTRLRTCQEFNNLTDEVETMRNKIHGIIEPIIEASDTVMASIQQLANASMNMSNAANRQAASLEQISSSMEEMGANIQQNTDNSVQTNNLAEEINSMVGQMGSATGESYDAIRNIANDVVAINELVMQTNILALNASVEAARAGEQGKGFAVVAKEVGRLADQTHETSDGINQTATSSIAQAETAYNQANELLPKIERVASLIKEITAASVEQNSGVGQVNSAILDLNRLTQENAAGAEEMAASTQELQRLIQDMTRAITIFKVK